MRVHFIAIGGSVMHNLAIALKLKGYEVTGSDDEIFEPAKSNLAKHGLLPAYSGWDASQISSEVDSIVLGMHAKNDNPELQKAKELGIKIYSFPEFLYEQSRNKIRVVIGGSHGKTTITSMILHILKKNDFDFDYMVGSSLQGFDLTVRLSDTAPVMILEGDEYPDSAINKTPKFHIYRPKIALISGIAWDHINVFTSPEAYVIPFQTFVDLIPNGGTLIFNAEDDQVRKMVAEAIKNIHKISYAVPDHEIRDGVTFLIWNGNEIPLKIFGRHNLQNMMGAVAVCKALGIEEKACLAAIRDFTGAARRLELLESNEHSAVFKDFAHSPSKLKATISAVKEQFPARKLIACLELHTYSSLNKEFLNEYQGGMQEADIRIIFCNQHTFEIKRMEPLNSDLIKTSFHDDSILVFTDAGELNTFLKSLEWKNSNLLMMSSGNFGGLDLKELSTFVVKHS